MERHPEQGSLALLPPWDSLSTPVPGAVRPGSELDSELSEALTWVLQEELLG